MISINELEQRFMDNPAVHYAKADGDGYHYTITLVSDQFEGKRNVGRQQWAYKVIQDWISNGSLHAVTLKTYTTKEWEA